MEINRIILNRILEKDSLWFIEPNCQIQIKNNDILFYVRYIDSGMTHYDYPYKIPLNLYEIELQKYKHEQREQKLKRILNETS